MNEVRRLDEQYAGRFIYAQSHLGPHLNRFEQTGLPADYATHDYVKGSIVVLSDKVNHYEIKDFEECVGFFAGDTNRFEALAGHEHIMAFRVR